MHDWVISLSISNSSPLTIAIIGATGRTGKWVLKCALRRGYRVRLLIIGKNNFLIKL